MNKKQLAYIFLIAFFVGAAGSILLGRFVIPYVATFPGMSGLNSLVSTSPIIVNRREEVQLNEGVNLIDLVKQSGNHTVTILNKDGNFIGNGLVATSDGMILTSEQVIAGQKTVQVQLNDGKILPALIRAADPKSDLVVLTIDSSNLSPSQFDSAATLQAGQRVFALGRSNDQYVHKFGTGFVSSTVKNSDRPETLRSSETFNETLATDILYDPEFAASPVFNLQGRVVAMMIAPDQYILAENIQSAVSSFLATQKITRPYLGIKYSVKNFPTPMLVVSNVEKNSPAEKSGLLANDQIVSIDGQDIGAASFEQTLNNHAVGAMKLGVTRAGKNLDLTVNLIAK